MTVKTMTMPAMMMILMTTMIKMSIGMFQFFDDHLIFIMEGVCPLHHPSRPGTTAGQPVQHNLRQVWITFLLVIIVIKIIIV